MVADLGRDIFLRKAAGEVAYIESICIDFFPAKGN